MIVFNYTRPMKTFSVLSTQRIRFGGRWLLPSAFLPSASEILDKAWYRRQCSNSRETLSRTGRFYRPGRCVGSYSSAGFRSARWRARCSSLQDKRGIDTPSYLSTYAASATASNTTFNYSSSSPSPSSVPYLPSSSAHQAPVHLSNLSAGVSSSSPAPIHISPLPASPLLKSPQNNLSRSGSILVDGIPLKRVEDYKYLGSWIFDSEKDMRVRIALAWKANIKHVKIWKCDYLGRNLKIRLFRSVVQAVLLYGAET